MDEQELIEKIRNPESRNYGFNLLVREYQEKIYWHVRQMVIDHDDANDVVQEVFVKVWKNLERFRGDSKLYTWVYRISTNECLNFLGKKRRKYMVSWGTAEKELSNKIDDSAYIEGDEVQRKLQKALLKLPDKQRLVFNMKYFEEMKYEEICEITGTSVGALKASYHHAVKKIEQSLKDELNL